jgi:hypothetical protein
VPLSWSRWASPLRKVISSTPGKQTCIHDLEAFRKQDSSQLGFKKTVGDDWVTMTRKSRTAMQYGRQPMRRMTSDPYRDSKGSCQLCTRQLLTCCLLLHVTCTRTYQRGCSLLGPLRGAEVMSNTARVSTETNVSYGTRIVGKAGDEWRQ